MLFYVFLCILMPLLGTTLGSCMVFVMKKVMSDKTERLLMGFASGIMIAASLWSLILPALEMSEKIGSIVWLPSSIGFMCGIFFLIIIDILIPCSNCDSVSCDDNKKSRMLMLAVTLHNIPEGMAVGVIIAGALQADTGIMMSSALLLSFGIAVQNFPEGAIISMPLRCDGMSRKKAFSKGFFSGVVEPIAAIITMLLTSIITPVLPYILAFAAGAMIYVVVNELIPKRSDNYDNMCVIGVAFGFTLMMILDVALG